jgi:3-oxoadipate enol-lactonase
MKILTVNGVRLATVDRGSGLPVLLVHGFPLDHTMWDAQVEVLSGRFRVIAPDLRGFGQSGLAVGQPPSAVLESPQPGAAVPQATTMDQFADDLAALVDALGITERVVLCGLSMGGYIAFALCRKYAARLRGLILCDTRAAADTPEAAAGRRETAEWVLREGLAPLADTMLPKLLAPATLAERPETVAALRKVILASDPRGIAAALRGMAERADSTPLLAQIAFPTLVLVGQEDSLSPVDQMQALARQIPNAQFVTIPNAGHLPPLEQPAETTAAIEGFLAAIA